MDVGVDWTRITPLLPPGHGFKHSQGLRGCRVITPRQLSGGQMMWTGDVRPCTGTVIPVEGPTAQPALPCTRGVQPQFSCQMWYQGTPLLKRECSLTPGIPWMSGWHPALQEPWGMMLLWWGCSHAQYQTLKCNLQWGWEKPAMPQSEQWLCFH